VEGRVDKQWMGCSEMAVVQVPFLTMIGGSLEGNTSTLRAAKLARALESKSKSLWKLSYTFVFT
jgi:hypothetical protein